MRARRLQTAQSIIQILLADAIGEMPSRRDPGIAGWLKHCGGRKRMSRKTKSLLPRLRRWRRGARWTRRKLARVPLMVRIAGVVAILLAALAWTNLVYHVIRKPTELFVFVGHGLDKEPAETWRQYGPLFRAYFISS
jgi:hypothetical protein